MDVDVIAEKYELANKWIRLQNKGISVLQQLKKKGIEKIILYGASEFALRLLEQYEKELSIIEVIGISDRKVSARGDFYCDIALLPLNEIAKLDEKNIWVVITAMGYCKEIMGELQNKGISNIVSLQELIDDAYC